MSPAPVRRSVPAVVSEFARAELEAFVAMSRCTGHRPGREWRYCRLPAARSRRRLEAARGYVSPGGLSRSFF